MAPEGKSRKPASMATDPHTEDSFANIFHCGDHLCPSWWTTTVSEIIIDYTYCDSRAPDYPKYENIPENFVESYFPQSNSTATWSREVFRPPEANFTDKNVWRCRLQFTIPSELKPPVFLYYRLTNFYQNHRRYVKSFDANQLKGVAVPVSTLKGGNCKPLGENDNQLAIYPCGLIANSIFNDTIYNLTLLNPAGGTNETESYEFTQKNIAWPSDKKKYGKTQYKPSEIAPPPDWVDNYPNGTYTDEYPPRDISTDETFQVWMRTAGLPDFRKLHGRNDNDILKVGTYEVLIDYKYPVTRYGGTKSLVISTVSFLGGKNPFLGIAYIASGIVCVLFGCIFTARHLHKPRKLGDHTYLSWNNQPAK
ncbi:9073_t:CDS:2 [Diversispora eburnea]|uniref:9073_t:CDS:1 n=1 Tax=Diversispora eburnea TaxID=1213867 RepID=A0A9N8Z4B1_9GLOM|nr:9073_t:CDS:2 [Diversispora eburnea]